MAVALLEYYVREGETSLFVGRSDWEKLLVYPLALSRSQLTQCADRLLVDFHGLPMHEQTQLSDYYRELLRLAPAINVDKRAQPIQERTLKKAAFAYPLDYWEVLGEHLIPEAARPHLESCSLLCIVPHGPLHRLPFAALRWDKSTYLIEKFGLCHVPSASVLRFCRAKNPRRQQDAAYIPRRGLIVAASQETDRAEPFEKEVEPLSQHLKAANIEPTILDGAQKATKAALLSCLAQQDIVHLACHGLFGAERGQTDPLGSALLLANGERVPEFEEMEAQPQLKSSCLLTAREIFALPPLHADLVTLRACSSGRAAIHSGDELLGLLRAFLYVGTPSMLVSLWNVNKASSSQLLLDFYDDWLTTPSIPKWKALQQAQCKMLRGTQYPHPYHWAAFTLVGDWL